MKKQVIHPYKQVVCRENKKLRLAMINKNLVYISCQDIVVESTEPEPYEYA